MLKQLDSLTEFNWIQDGLDELLPLESEKWRGNFVSHCLPPTFDSYCKVLHPIFVDLDYVNSPAITWDDIKDNDEQADSISDGALIDGDTSNPNFHLERIKWKKLAEQLGLKFHSEISDSSFFRALGRRWPRYLIGPDEGGLDKKTCRDIVSVLTPFTGSQHCFFEYFVMATEKIETNLLFAGSLNDVQQSFSLDSVRGSPTYWWPQDRSWCLCTDWDLCFTLLGGAKEVIENVFMHDELEALRVKPHTRIDYYADQINFPG